MVCCCFQFWSCKEANWSSKALGSLAVFMLGNRDWSHCLQHPMIVQGLSSSSKLSTKEGLYSKSRRYLWTSWVFRIWSKSCFSRSFPTWSWVISDFSIIKVCNRQYSSMKMLREAGVFASGGILREDILHFILRIWAGNTEPSFV